MVLKTREIGGDNPEKTLDQNTPQENDLKPEYCQYRDEGCEYARACLECPFPQCLYDEPRCQLRWNKTSAERCVKDIIATILARAGIKLEVKSQSSTVTGFYPDFTISPGDNGKTVIEKLLSFVPDVIFMEGNKAYLVNPQSTDASEYSYGTAHAIHEGRYRQGALVTNRAQVEGYDTSQSKMFVVDSFDWVEVGRLYDRIRRVDDRNLSSSSQGYQRGAALLRKATITAVGGSGFDTGELRPAGL